MAARGVVDFANADLLGARFWRQIRHVAESLDRDLAALSRRASLDVALASYAATAAVDPSKLSQVGAEVDRAAEAYREILFPGITAATESGKRAVMMAMEREWIGIWGDPALPEVRAKIEDVCRRLAGPVADDKPTAGGV